METGSKKISLRLLDWLSVHYSKEELILVEDALYMLLAFLVDQLWQKCSQLFNQLWQRAKSKRYLWELIRAVFFLRPVSSFQEIYHTIAAEFSIQLE